MNCVYYSVYNPNKLLIKQLNTSISTLKQFNPNLNIIVFSNKPIEGVDVVLFDFTMDKHSELTHKHIHYGKLNNYDTTLFLDCDTLIGGNLTELFEKCYDGIHMREENIILDIITNGFYKKMVFIKDKNIFNSGVIFTDKKTRNIINDDLNTYLKMVNNTSDTDRLGGEQKCFSDFCLSKGLIINQLSNKDVGVGGVECSNGKQIIKHYFSRNTKYFI